MQLIAGTIPIQELPLVIGEAGLNGDSLTVNEHAIPCTQGTGALLNAALSTTSYLNLEPPQALLAGDIGKGKGSRQIYQYLIEHVTEISPAVLTLHYLLPDMALTRQLCQSVAKCSRRPLMIADAAAMYAAKAAGLAGEFDIFTPDASEVAFLADPDATHPAYIARHLFDTEVSDIPALIAQAYQNQSAANLLLAKGAIDYIARDGEIVATISEPDVPALEAIGGTGDTITGLVSAFVDSGLEPHQAAILAARANRAAGEYAQATPATKIGQVISQYPAVFKEHLCQWSGVCYSEGENDDG